MKFFRGLKQKVDIFIGTKTIFNPKLNTIKATKRIGRPLIQVITKIFDFHLFFWVVIFEQPFLTTSFSSLSICQKQGREKNEERE